MYLLSLFLSTILLSSCTGDLIISDDKNNEHIIVDEDLTLIRKLDFKFNGPLRKVRKTENGLVAYAFEKGDVSMYTVSNVGKVSKIGTIAINENDKIVAFDVQPSGELAVMSSINKIYLFSQKDNKSTEVPEIDFKADVVFIHPTERIIYYAKCLWTSADSLFVLNLETNEKQQQNISSCSFHIDFKENIIWDVSDRHITKINIKTKTSEVITSIPTDSYSASDLSSDHLFFMRSNKKKEIFRLPTSPELIKQKSLQEYSTEPVLTKASYSLGDFGPFLLIVDKALVDVFDFDFKKITYEFKIEVEKKPILLLKTFNGGSNIFWIYESNQGTVEYAKVNFIINEVENRGSFQVPTDGESIADFDADVMDWFFFATQQKIIKIRMKDFEPNKEIESIKPPFDEPIKAVGLHLFDLIVSYCNEAKSGLVGIDIYRDARQKKIFDSAPRCSERILVDGESIIASSSTGLYNIGLDDEAEQICNLTGIKHFVIRRDFVYFVSKIEGPGIYKVNKRRIAKIDHNLPLRDDGEFVITKIKELEKDKSKTEIPENKADDPRGGNKSPDVHPNGKTITDKTPKGSSGNKNEYIDWDKDIPEIEDYSKDIVKEKISPNVKKGSSSSKVAPPAQMILLLLIQLVAQLVP